MVGPYPTVESNSVTNLSSNNLIQAPKPSTSRFDLETPKRSKTKFTFRRPTPKSIPVYDPDETQMLVDSE